MISQPNLKGKKQGAGTDVQWERKNGVLAAALARRVDGGNAEEFQCLREKSLFLLPPVF